MTRNPHFYENAAHALVTDLSSRFGLGLGLEFRLPLVEAGRLLDKRTAQVETFNRARGKWKKHARTLERVNAELAALNHDRHLQLMARDAELNRLRAELAQARADAAPAETIAGHALAELARLATVDADLARARETIATLHAAYTEAEDDIRYADAVRRLIAGLDAVAPAWRYSRPDERTARVWDEFLCVVDGSPV